MIHWSLFIYFFFLGFFPPKNTFFFVPTDNMISPESDLIVNY